MYGKGERARQDKAFEALFSVESFLGSHREKYGKSEMLARISLFLSKKRKKKNIRKVGDIYGKFLSKLAYGKVAKCRRSQTTCFPFFHSP